MLAAVRADDFAGARALMLAGPPRDEFMLVQFLELSRLDQNLTDRELSEELLDSETAQVVLTGPTPRGTAQVVFDLAVEDDRWFVSQIR
jgi:hypothetical protein